ncbi:unnamed protein product [Cuscuta campestris]|uniref:Uncharacterized protein n=1 Tax=Cuscuta campestris TaxID=132261 RepID=A0A484KNR8_9ASTE|nr:unnamed protein product [Cuscuta campestris]
MRSRPSVAARQSSGLFLLHGLDHHDRHLGQGSHGQPPDLPRRRFGHVAIAGSFPAARWFVRPGGLSRSRWSAIVDVLGATTPTELGENWVGAVEIASKRFVLGDRPVDLAIVGARAAIRRLGRRRHLANRLCCIGFGNK